MPGDPTLTAFAFAADPVAHDLPVVGITVPLQIFVVHEATALACADWRIGIYGFSAEIKFGHTRHMREIETRAPGSATGCINGRYVVVNLAVGIEREPVTKKGKPVREIECAETSSGIVAAEFVAVGWRLKADEAFQEGVKR